MSNVTRLNLVELGFVKVGPRELRFPSGAQYQVADGGRIVIEIEGRTPFYIPGAAIGSAANTLIVPNTFIN